MSSSPSFRCPRCGRTSHNPSDVREGYCGACHDWTRGDLPPQVVGHRSACVIPTGGCECPICAWLGEQLDAPAAKP